MNSLLFVACVFTISNAEYLSPNYQTTNSIVPSHGSSDGPGSSYVAQVYYSSGGSGNYVSPVYKPQVQNDYVPVIKDGVPVDTPEVQQAKAEHFALYAKAAAQAQAAKAVAAQRQQGSHYGGGNYITQAYYPSSASQYAQTQDSYIYQSGGHLSNSGAYAHQAAGPVDTAEVQQAKAAHLVALQRAAARASTPEHHRYRRSILGYDLTQLQHQPLITKDGVPVETPEVQVAKAQHFQAHANARAGHQEWDAGNYQSGSGIWTNYGTPEVNKVQYSINHNYGSWQPYTGPQHYPQIDKNGVPVETPEVQLAKQEHFLAHSKAKLGLYGQAQAGSYYGSSYPYENITPDGVPEETPEVQIAKAQHFAAHAEEQAKHAKWAGQVGSGYGNEYSYKISSHY